MGDLPALDCHLQAIGENTVLVVRVPTGAKRAGPAGGSKSTQEGAASKVTSYSAGSRLAHHASAKKRTQLLPRVAKDIVVKREGGHGKGQTVTLQAGSFVSVCVSFAETTSALGDISRPVA